MTQAGNASILLVDDDEQLLAILVRTLQLAGFANVETATSGHEARAVLNRREYSLVLLDINLPDQSGREIFTYIADRYPDTPVIFLTGGGDLECAVDCMRLGACDYLTKPLVHDRLIAAVKRAFELRSFRTAVSSINENLADETIGHKSAFAPILTRDPAMLKLFRYLEVIAPSLQPVLITGETGVGKELFARALHEASGRRGAFVAVNVAGLDDLVFADTLFGHRKGAFTGADHGREGLIATAADGTLFLDEIGDLREQSQIKLLRLLQENEYFALGEDSPRRNQARVVLATNRDLEQMMGEGTFRKDLYFRIATHRIDVPPLRCRPVDIPLLLDRFIDDAAAGLGRKRPYAPPELAVLLAGHSFPGNVRELQAMVHDAVAHATSGKLALERFRRMMAETKEAASAGSVPAGEPGAVVFHRFPTLREAEDFLVAESLRRAGGNQGVAATMLGVTRQALNNRLRRRVRT